MAMDPTALRNVCESVLYNSIVSRVQGSIGSNLSPTQRADALNSYKTIAGAVADMVPVIINFIKNNAEITSTEFLSFGTGKGYFLGNAFGTELQDSVGDTVAGVIKTRSTIR